MATAILSNPRSTVQSATSPGFLTSAQAGELCGLSFMSIVRACNRGEIEHHTLPSGHRRILRSSLCTWAGLDDTAHENLEQPEQGDGLIVGYYRVSTTEQVKQGNLQRQKDRLEAFIKATYPGREYVLLGECGSGVNSDRRFLGKVIDLALEGKMSILVAEFAERISRGSYAILSRIFEKCGVEIVLTRQGEQENMGQSLLDEGIYDCLALMTSIGAKVNGSKATKVTQVIYPPGLVERVSTLHGSGLSKRAIIQTIESEGWKDLNHTDRPIGEHSIRKIVANIKMATPSDSAPVVPQHILSFIEVGCTVSATKYTHTSDLYRAYCKLNPVESAKLTARKFVDTLKVVVPNSRIERDGGNGHRFYGLTLKR